MKMMSEIFFLAPNMYFTDRKANFGLAPFFFYRGPYFCNRNSYNVDTSQTRVFGVDKSSVKIWYCVLPGCVFSRPERNFFKRHPCNLLTCWLNFRIFLQSAQEEK